MARQKKKYKKMFLITSEQIRACRSILRWTVEELSTRSDVSISTIKRIEKADGYPSCRLENIERLRAAFEETGIIHLPDSKTIIILHKD